MTSMPFFCVGIEYRWPAERYRGKEAYEKVVRVTVLRWNYALCPCTWVYSESFICVCNLGILMKMVLQKVAIGLAYMFCNCCTFFLNEICSEPITCDWPVRLKTKTSTQMKAHVDLIWLGCTFHSRTYLNQRFQNNFVIFQHKKSF